MMLVEGYLPLFRQDNCAYTSPLFVLTGSMRGSLPSLLYSSSTESEPGSVQTTALPERPSLNRLVEEGLFALLILKMAVAVTE